MNTAAATTTTLLILSITFFISGSAQPMPPSSCPAELVAFSPCLPFVSAPPNNVTETVPYQCCDSLSLSIDSGGGNCLCYLLRQPLVFGFPLNQTRLLSLSTLCKMKGSLASVCLSGSPALPPLSSIGTTGLEITKPFPSDTKNSTSPDSGMSSPSVVSSPKSMSPPTVTSPPSSGNTSSPSVTSLPPSGNTSSPSVTPLPPSGDTSSPAITSSPKSSGDTSPPAITSQPKSDTSAPPITSPPKSDTSPPPAVTSPPKSDMSPAITSQPISGCISPPLVISPPQRDRTSPTTPSIPLRQDSISPDKTSSSSVKPSTESSQTKQILNCIDWVLPGIAIFFIIIFLM